jgi:Zn-finger nucleic acid-binding protein
MQPQCPKCRSVHLQRAEGTLAHLDVSERVLACPVCGGYFLPHKLVEHWHSEPFVEPGENSPESMRPELDRKTGLCPMGHGILVRARVDGDQVFHLERCGFCRGVWLDRGEWQRLASSRFLQHLDDLWDPTWQRQQRDERLQRTLDRALFDQLGAELYRDLVTVIGRLKEHPSRAQALAWISEHLDPHAHPTQIALPSSATIQLGQLEKQKT